MFFVWALALSGLFLIYLEFFLPGAIMAIGGAILLLASVFVYHMLRPGATHLIGYLIILAGAIFALVRFAGWRVRLANKATHSFPKHLVGKKGKAATDLKPSGDIFVDDKTFQAFAQKGFIDKGADIKIIGGEGIHLIVETDLEK